MPDPANGPTAPLRFGLVGTGFWARITHAPALSSTDGIELVGVWGRDVEAARVLAAVHGAEGYADVDELIETVDAVAFAVPPDVQCSMALRAAKAGKHLLLEKPIATSLATADSLVQAVTASGVASVVFFTSRFQSDVRNWLSEIAGQANWVGGSGVWLGTALAEGNPFNTPWRREKGGLWDLGPHAVSLLWAALGPVVGVTADGGLGDLAHLVLHHEGGATSVVTVTVGASEAAEMLEFFVWGASGRSVAPREATEPKAALRVALAELAANARAGVASHPCDVRFGRDVVRVLADAEAQISAGRWR
jgi:predicted dehydrogenase